MDPSELPASAQVWLNYVDVLVTIVSLMEVPWLPPPGESEGVFRTPNPTEYTIRRGAVRAWK